MSIKNLYMRCLATLHGKVSAIDERGIDPIDYSCDCLRLISDRIVDLKDVADGFDTWKDEMEKMAALVADEEALRLKVSDTQ